jgi:hypothetical protein
MRLLMASANPGRHECGAIYSPFGNPWRPSIYASLLELGHGTHACAYIVNGVTTLCGDATKEPHVFVQTSLLHPQHVEPCGHYLSAGRDAAERRIVTTSMGIPSAAEC